MFKQLKEHSLRKPEEEGAHQSVQDWCFLTKPMPGCWLWIARSTGHQTWDTLPAATVKLDGPKHRIALVGCSHKLLFHIKYLLKSNYL